MVVPVDADCDELGDWTHPALLSRAITVAGIL